MSYPCYQVGTYLFHPERGTYYRIEDTPLTFKLKSGSEWLPAYSYRNIHTGEAYARAQPFIESERYVPIKYSDIQPAPQPMLVGAAMRSCKDGLIIPSARHWDTELCRPLVTALGREDDAWEQGFIDCMRNFLTREEALERAKITGQFKFRCGGDMHELFSENLYR